MGNATARLARRRDAARRLNEAFRSVGHTLIVHYSCESFVDRQALTSPRVTSIAVANLGSGEIRSFSIHLLAERKGLAEGEILPHYDELERSMLEEFNTYLTQHRAHTWMHWNMRDVNYGFPAIAQRGLVLGLGVPEYPEGPALLDLARALKDIYGPRYAPHRRFEKIAERNGLRSAEFLTGAEEAEAFVAGEYMKLHRSTLQKVHVMADIATRAHEGTLSTYAPRWEWPRYYLLAAIELGTETTVGRIIGGVSLIGAVASGVVKVMGLFGVS